MLLAESNPNAQVNSEPAAGFSFKRLLPTIVFDVAMPIIAFNLLSNYGVSTLWALVAGGLFPALNNLRVGATRAGSSPSESS
jgi:hypothetical protein